MHTPTSPSMPYARFAGRPSVRGGLAGAAALLQGPALAQRAGARTPVTPSPATAVPFGAEPLPRTAVGPRGELHLLLQEYTYLAGNTTDALLTSGPSGGALRGQIAERLSAHVAYTLQAIEALAGRDVGMACGRTGGAARRVDEIAARVSVALGSASAVDGNMAAS